MYSVHVHVHIHIHINVHIHIHTHTHTHTDAVGDLLTSWGRIQVCVCVRVSLCVWVRDCERIRIIIMMWFQSCRASAQHSFMFRRVPSCSVHLPETITTNATQHCSSGVLCGPNLYHHTSIQLDPVAGHGVPSTTLVLIGDVSAGTSKRTSKNRYKRAMPPNMTSASKCPIFLAPSCRGGFEPGNEQKWRCSNSFIETEEGKWLRRVRPPLQRTHQG